MAGFVKFDGIEGQSADAKHKGWSDLANFSHSYGKAGGGTGARRRGGDVTVSDMRMRIDLDKAAPKIGEACLSGKVFPKIELHVTASYTDAGRETYYSYELKNAQVTNYDVGADTDGDGRPEIELAVNFEEVKVTYAETDSKGKKKGNIEYGWKVEEAEK